MRWEKGVYSVLVGIPDGKRPLGRPGIPFITQECTVYLVFYVSACRPTS